MFASFILMRAGQRGQTDRQAGRQSDRQTDRQKGRQADRQAGRQMQRDCMRGRNGNQTYQGLLLFAEALTDP